MKAKEFIPATKPRNFVAKNQKTAGAGAHKDKKRAEKQGDVKHKAKQFEQGVAEGSYTTEKQILTRIRQIMHDRKLSGTESNAGELLRLKQQLKDLRNQQSVEEGDYPDGSSIKTPDVDEWKQQYQQAVMAVKNAKTKQEYEAASDRAGRIKDLLASKGIKVGPALGQQDVEEGSDWGEPKEILEDVLQTLEREVEWPLTEVMDPKQVRQLLAPIVRAVNDKLLSIDEVKYKGKDVEEGIGGTIVGGVGQFFGNKIDPLSGEIMRAHGEIAGRKAEYTIRKYMHLLQKALKQQLDSGEKEKLEDLIKGGDDLEEGTPGNDFRVGQRVMFKSSNGQEIPAIVTAVDFDEDAVKIKSADNKPLPNSGGDFETTVDPGWKFLTPEPRVDPNSIIAVSPNMRKTTERVRDPEDWDEGNTEPPNNFAIYINGKKWKVFKGRGQFADDYKEIQHFRQLQAWAQQKSAQSGKKWEVHRTGEGPTA